MTLTTKLIASAGFLALSTGLAATAPAVHSYGGPHHYRSQTEFRGQHGVRGERQYRGEQRAVRGETRGQVRSAPQAPQAATIGGNNAMKNEKSTTGGGANR